MKWHKRIRHDDNTASSDTNKQAIKIKETTDQTVVWWTLPQMLKPHKRRHHPRKWGISDYLSLIMIEYTLGEGHSHRSLEYNPQHRATQGETMLPLTRLDANILLCVRKVICQQVALHVVLQHWPITGTWLIADFLKHFTTQKHQQDSG